MSKISVQTREKRFPVAPDLYGLFFEDISRAGDGGLYPEMLRNRSFEDSLMPEGCTSSDGGKTFVTPTGWIDAPPLDGASVHLFEGTYGDYLQSKVAKVFPELFAGVGGERPTAETARPATVSAVTRTVRGCSRCQSPFTSRRRGWPGWSR